MLIKNRTKNTITSSNAVEAKSFLQKALGLILHGRMDDRTNTLVFRTRFGIHTFFLKDSIDVLVLDDNNLVVDMNPYMKPWRIFVWDTKYSLVVELPAGKIGKSKTQIGDQIEMV